MKMETNKNLYTMGILNNKQIIIYKEKIITPKSSAWLSTVCARQVFQPCG